MPTSRIDKKEVISAIADMTSFGISLVPFPAGVRRVIYSTLSLGHQERDVARAAIVCVGPLNPARQASEVVAQPVCQLSVGRLRHFAKLRARIGDDEVDVHGGARV